MLSCRLNWFPRGGHVHFIVHVIVFSLSLSPRGGHVHLLQVSEFFYPGFGMGSDLKACMLCEWKHASRTIRVCVDVWTLCPLGWANNIMHHMIWNVVFTWALSKNAVRYEIWLSICWLYWHWLDMQYLYPAQLYSIETMTNLLPLYQP